MIDDATTDLLAMPAHDADPEQKPAFRVTGSTADLVRQDFGRYQPSLERMLADWQEEKKRFMQEREFARRDGTDAA